MYRLYWSVETVLTPGLQNSQFAYKGSLQSYVGPNTTWLDVGCGHQLLPEFMPTGARDEKELIARSRLVVGMDRDLGSLARHKSIQYKVCGELNELPFTDKSFDLVTANMVFEHAEDPDRALREVFRVLKSGGFLLFHTPNARGYSTLFARIFPQRFLPLLSRFLLGRKPEDVYQTFYRLNTLPAVNSAARRNGFRVAEIEWLESSAQTIMLGPIVIVELLLIRLLRFKSLATLRTNFIAVLQKQ